MGLLSSRIPNPKILVQPIKVLRLYTWICFAPSDELHELGLGTKLSQAKLRPETLSRINNVVKFKNTVHP